MEILRRLRNTEEGKAEVARFKEAKESLREERKALRQTIREEIQGGTAPKEAVEQHADEVKDLIEQGMDLRIDHHDNMLDVARKYTDEGVEHIYNKILEHIGNRGRGRRRRGGEDNDYDDEGYDGDEDYDDEDDDEDDDRPRRPRRHRRPPPRRRRYDDDDEDDFDDDDGPFEDVDDDFDD